MVSSKSSSSSEDNSPSPKKVFNLNCSIFKNSRVKEMFIISSCYQVDNEGASPEKPVPPPDTSKNLSIPKPVADPYDDIPPAPDFKC